MAIDPTKFMTRQQQVVQQPKKQEPTRSNVAVKEKPQVQQGVAAPQPKKKVVKQQPKKKVVKQQPKKKQSSGISPEEKRRLANGEALKDYETLSAYGGLLKPALRMPIGREVQIDDIDANLARVEMNNVALLGPAGVGKTSLMEGYAKLRAKEGVLVIEADLALMSDSGDNAFAGRLKRFADEVMDFVNRREEAGLYADVIVFLDEMHLITMSGNTGTGGGSAAGNAIKPMMARGMIKIVGATTDEEYDNYIKPDQALTRRFQSLHIPEPDFDTTVTIIRDMAIKYLGREGVDRVVDPVVYHEIVDYTNRFLPAFSQPAKSLDIMDAAIGYHRAKGWKIDHDMIALIMRNKAGADVDWTTDIDTVMTDINNRVMGQGLALEMIKNRLYVANAGLQDEGRPVANLLFAGPTGVGKTELAKALADSMFGDEDAMIRFDMSEFSQDKDVEIFQDRISAAINKQPYAVVLLDEFEKACRPIMNLMLGVLDDGRLTDKYGRQVTFTNAMMILTTNGAADAFKTIREQGMDIEEVDNFLRSTLGDTFSPEFLGRFDEIIPFAPLDEEGFHNIGVIQLKNQVKKVQERYGIQVTFDMDVATYLVNEDFTPLRDTSAGGGRAMKRRIEREVVPLFARAIDITNVEGRTILGMRLSVAGTMMATNKDILRGDAGLEISFMTDDNMIGTLRMEDIRPLYQTLENFQKEQEKERRAKAGELSDDELLREYERGVI